MDRETITIPAPKFNRGQLVQFAGQRGYAHSNYMVIEQIYELSRGEWFYGLRMGHHSQPVTVEEIALCATPEQAE